MTNEELQTLIDINSSHSFQELQSRTAARLTALQMSQRSTPAYDSLNDLLKAKAGMVNK